MKIIGLSGKKQSGKTTAAMFLNKMTNSKVIPFAQTLKQIVQVCFGATEAQLNGTDEQKNTKLACGKTVRDVLQIVGVDWFRELDEGCWIRAWERHAQLYYKSDMVVIVPDVRFANEVQRIQKFDGHVIRLTRAPFKLTDKHESEVALDDAPENVFDYILDNKAMSIDEQNKAFWEILCERKWV